MKESSKYKEVNGTSYHSETAEKVINVLENVRMSKTRITLDYGDVKTGVSWGEVYDISGTIGRSTGTIKIPLLIHNKRSYGGGGILDHCIIGIKESRGGRILYKLTPKN